MGKAWMDPAFPSCWELPAGHEQGAAKAKGMEGRGAKGGNTLFLFSWMCVWPSVTIRSSLRLSQHIDLSLGL